MKVVIMPVQGSLSSYKIKPWHEAAKEIKEAIKNQNERLSITIPYGLQLENYLWNPENLRVAVHVTSSCRGDCFLSHHGVGQNNKLNLWTITTSKATSVTKTALKTFPTPFKFQHFLFITKRWVYISYCIDMTLYVFSSKFIRISAAFAGRTILSLEYNHERDEVLTGIAGGVMIWNFPIKQTDQLIPGRIIDCSFSLEQWTSSLKVDPLWNQIVVISKEKIAVLETKNYKSQIFFSKTTEVPLMSCVMYNPMNYFIIGDQSGMIRVMSSSLFSLPQVTQFLGHCDAVTSLVTHHREPLLISGSCDKTIRIWNFDTFTQTFCLQTGEEVLHADLINPSKLYYRSEHSIKVWYMNLFHTLFATLSSKIIRIMRTESPDYPARILVHAIDGGIRLISPVTGSQLTAVLPITTLNSAIVDVCHDRRRELIYVVLGNLEVIVFESDSNPCCASQRWRADYTDEGICSIALLNAEYALGEKDMELESSLVFAGHNNGQISLLDGHGVEMKNNIQAHQGQVIRLCSSHGHRVPNKTLETLDHLVSLGKDSVIRVWRVRHVREMTIGVELKCEVRLMSIPTDIAMIGKTLCMVMSDFRVVMARVKVKSRGVFTKDKPCDLLFHSKDEGHIAAINGLSSCPHLKLFATSSDDQSVKVWNTKNQLVRELTFDDTLCGVCFANHRGDLLVGFQCHISLVTITNYLPGTYLEMISSMHFENDPVERYVQFDDHLQFWYDPKLVPTLPMELSQRRPLLPPEETPQPWEEESESDSEEVLIPVIEEDGLKWLRAASRRMSITTRASISSRISFLSRGEHEEGRLSSALFGSKASSLINAQGKDVHDLESVISHLRTSQQEDNFLISLEELVRLRAEQKERLLPPHYWPCAPDCFIPNSVIRKHIKFRGLPAHMVPQIIRPIKAKKTKKERKKSADTMESTKKALRRKMIITPSRKLKPATKTVLKSEGFKKPEFTPRSFAPPATVQSELRQRRRTLPASQPDAIFEEMSEGEYEEEGEEEEEEEEYVEEYVEEDLVSPVIEEKKKSVLIDPEASVVDYEEEDEISSSSSSSASDGEELEEEEIEDEEMKEQKIVIKPIERKEDLGVKPVLRYPIHKPKPAQENILQQIVRKSWYPTKRKGNIEVNEVLDNMIKVLAQENVNDFAEVCTDIIKINWDYGISESTASLIHEILLKRTWHDDSNVRRKAIETLRQLKFKKKHTTLAMISRVVDEDKDVRDEAKDALRDLHEIYTIEDLTDTLLKLGVVSFELPCNDNVVLSELMDRLRVIKEVNEKREQEKERKRKLKEEKKKKCRPSVAKRRESMFGARRRSLKPAAREVSARDTKEFRHELKETILGCRLLQQLSPVTNILYSQFFGSTTSLSTKGSLEEMSLVIAGKKIRKSIHSARTSLSSRASFRGSTMAGSSSVLLPRLDIPSSTVITATAARRHSRNLGTMLGGLESSRRLSLRKQSVDLTSGVIRPLTPTRKGKLKVREKEREEVEEEMESVKVSFDKIKLDDLVEVLNEINSNHVGRALLFSLMHIIVGQSKRRLSFYIPDVLNLISHLPDMMKQKLLVFDTVLNILQGKAEDKVFILEELKVKINQTLLSELLQIRMDFQGRDQQMAEVDILMTKYREELKGEWAAKDSSHTCSVGIVDLMWILSVMSDDEDRKFFIKKVIRDALKQLEYIPVASKRHLINTDTFYTVGKPNKAIYAEKMQPYPTDTLQGGDKKIRDAKPLKTQKKTYKKKEVGVDHLPSVVMRAPVHRHLSVLRTPVRRSLVPGINGERLAHSLDINRPLPNKEIERLMTERIVKSLPYRLSFHTGAREWGLSKYGILEVTWTSRGPRYTISDVDINGKAFKKNITNRIAYDHFSHENLRQSNNDVSKKESPDVRHGEKRTRLSDEAALIGNKKSKTLPSVSRSKLRKIPTPSFAVLGQDTFPKNEISLGCENTFCINDTYSTPPVNSQRRLSPLTLPSLSIKNKTSQRGLANDEIFMPSIP